MGFSLPPHPSKHAFLHFPSPDEGSFLLACAIPLDWRGALPALGPTDMQGASSITLDFRLNQSK